MSDPAKRGSIVSRGIVALTIVSLVLVVSVAALWFRNRVPNEPIYNGRPLSYWAQKFEQDTNAGAYLPFRLSDESATAVRAMGTNAVPTLLKWMVRPEDGFDGRVLTWVNDDRLPVFARRALVPVLPKSYRPHSAIFAFRILGAEAHGAVPALEKMLQSPNNAQAAVMALCAIGSEGETAFEKAFPLIDDGILRANIINHLEHGITPALENSCAMFLAERLNQDPHSAVRMSIARVLGSLTNSAAIAVPALAQAVRGQDDGARLVACSSLEKFGTNALSAIADLEGALNDDNSQTRRDAARALRSIQKANEK